MEKSWWFLSAIQSKCFVDLASSLWAGVLELTLLQVLVFGSRLDGLAVGELGRIYDALKRFSKKRFHCSKIVWSVFAWDDTWQIQYLFFRSIEESVSEN